MDIDFATDIYSLPIPSAEEISALGLIDHNCNTLLYTDGKPTQLYIQIQAAYKLIFSGLFLSRTGLERLNARLLERGHTARPKNNYYQKYDYMGLELFYLRSFAHIERLESGELAVFQHLLEVSNDENILNTAAGIVSNTFIRVFSTLPGYPNRKFEVFPTVDGSGIVGGEDILLVLCSDPAYDEEGYLTDWDKDTKRIMECSSVAQQLENICSRALQCTVRVILVA